MKKFKFNDNVAHLFSTPDFKRENFGLDLYVAYSPKLECRHHVYTRARYLLWQKFEIDPQVLFFNCRVTKQAVPTKDGGAAEFSLDAMTLTEQGVVAHVIQGLKDVEDDEGDSKKSPDPEGSKCVTREDVNWEKWCHDKGIALKRWTVTSLTADAPTRMAMTRLVRYAGLANRLKDASLRQKIVDALARVSYLSIGDLLNRFSQLDPDAVMPEIADLVLGGKAFTDVHLSPLTTRTLVSVRDIFQKA